MEKIEVGEIVRSIRKSRGITATFMAKELGYKSVSGYSRLEAGESPITLEQAKKISDLLMVNIEELLNAQNLRESRKSATSA